MRDKLLKIYVSPNQFKKIQNSLWGAAEFLELSDNQPIEMQDFIVFADRHGNELLRNMSKIEKNTIHYVNYSDFYSNQHFPLVVVLCHLYESIMYLRLNTFTDENRFPPDFPSAVIKQKIDSIRLCLDMLENSIDPKLFIDKLNFLITEENGCPFKSSAAIMELYPWDFRLSRQNVCLIDKICQALTKIRSCLEKKEDWKNIWRLAYDVHNLPSSIYGNFVEQ